MEVDKERIKKYIKNDMHEEESVKTTEIRQKAKENNELRSEGQKGRFCWRLKDQKLKKWPINVKTTTETE